MRLFLFGVAICAATTSALAAPLGYYQPGYESQASMYLSFAFDRPPVQRNQPDNAALRYGFQFDSGINNHVDAQRAPLLRWEFSDLKFDNLSLSGQPLLNREMLLREDEDGGAFGFLKDHFGIIALSVGAIIVVGAVTYGAIESDDRKPSDTSGPGSRDNN